MNAAVKQKTVLIKRTFNISISTMWKAWTEEDSLKKWWGPKGFTCPTAKIDFRIGGKSLACMKGSDGKEYWSIFNYKEIIPLKRIVYDDKFSDEKGNDVPASYYDMPGEWPESLQVTLTFEESEGKTRMTLQHENIPSEMHDDCMTGWQQSFDKLEECFKK